MAAGIEIGAAYVSIVPSTRGIAQQLQRELGQPAEKAGKDAGRAIEDGLSGGANRGAQAAKLAISAIGSAAILQGLNRAKDAASNLQQAVGGTASVFQEASGAVDDFAENAAESVGLSERAARELTSKLGASLKGYGFAVDEAAAKSIDLTNIGADLAATFGGTTAEAVDALGSALRGEFDPLERFGIALRQSAIDAKAVDLGLAESTTNVSSYARAQAALAIITEQSADAQGQFARESDSAAGQAQISSAKVENSAANLGESLLPIYARISEGVGQVADVFAALPGPVQNGILALAGVVAVAGPISNVVTLYRTLVPAVTAATTATIANEAATNSAAAVQGLYATRLGASAIAARGLAAAVPLAAAGIAVFGVNAARTGTQAKLSQQALEAMQRFIERGDFDPATDSLDDLRAEIERVNGAGARLTEEFNNTGIAEGQLRRQINEAIGALNPYAEQLQQTADQVTELAEAEGISTEEAYNLIQANGGVPPALGETGTAARNSARQILNWADSLDRGISKLRDFYGQLSSAGDAQASFRENLRGIVDVGAQMADGTLAGQEALDAFRNQLEGGRDDIIDYAEALFRQGKTTDEVIPLVQDMAAELLATADQAGLTAGQTQSLATELGLLPDQVETNIRSNVGTVLADFLELRAAALAFGFQDLRTDIVLGPGSNFQARASGGQFDPGWLFVGEEGPELIKVGAGVHGTVFDAATSQRMIATSTVASPPSSGQSFTVNVYNPVAEPASESARHLRRAALEMA